MEPSYSSSARSVNVGSGSMLSFHVSFTKVCFGCFHTACIAHCVPAEAHTVRAVLKGTWCRGRVWSRQCPSSSVLFTVFCLQGPFGKFAESNTLQEGRRSQPGTQSRGRRPCALVRSCDQIVICIVQAWSSVCTLQKPITQLQPACPKVS